MSGQRGPVVARRERSCAQSRDTAETVVSGIALAGGDVQKFFDQHVAQGAGSLVLAITGLLLAIWFVHFLYRRKIFLRL